MSFNDKVSASDVLIIEKTRTTKSGKILPADLWPCHCLVCGEELSDYLAREYTEKEASVVEVMYLHQPGSRCGNTQRTILGAPQAEEVKPRFPCPKCGKETLEHRGPVGTRICSAATCRHVIEPAPPA